MFAEFIMRFLNLNHSFHEFYIVIPRSNTSGAIYLGNEVSAAVDRAVKKLKPFSWNCLVNITKSIVAIGKQIEN